MKMQIDGPEVNEEQLAVVLDECLEAMLREGVGLDDCLARYPAYAAQLRDMLFTASQVNRLNNLEPASAFRNRTRTELQTFIRSHTSKPVLTYRFAFILASLVLGFLTTGTALAQDALPGDGLYEWKLASEQAWRWTATDPIDVDIKLTERRSSEVLAVIEDPKRSLRAWEEYQKAEMKLISEIMPENENRITSVIHTQRKTLEQSGITLPPVKKNKPGEPDSEVTPFGPSNFEMPSQIESSNPAITGDAKSEKKDKANPN